MPAYAEPVSSYGFERSEAADGSHVRIALSGELDLTNARELERRLESACGPETSLVVDLNRVSFIDSAALHVFFRLARGCGERLRILLEPTASIAYAGHACS
mgnify:CR=1 FL=1